MLFDTDGITQQLLSGVKLTSAWITSVMQTNELDAIELLFRSVDGALRSPQRTMLRAGVLEELPVWVLTLSDPISALVRHYDFPVPDAFLYLLPFPIQFFCHPHTPQLFFILGGKEVGGLLVIILQFNP
jgi:hypothetical protein